MDDEKKSKLWILDAVKSLGLPTVFLCILLYMIWTAGVWAGTEVVIPLFKRQMSFIDDASTVTKQMGSAISQIEQTIRELDSDDKVALSKINETKNAVLEIGEEHKKLFQKISSETEANNKTREEQLLILKKIEENTSPKQGS